MTVEAPVSLTILKQNLKENWYFLPVQVMHGVHIQNDMPWNDARNFHISGLHFFLKTNIFGGMNFMGSFKDLLLFWNRMTIVIDISTFTTKRNTSWKQLCLAMRAPSEAPHGQTQFLEEIQRLNSFRSCDSEGHEALMAWKIWDV